MKFKNLVWTLSKDDILSICKLLDKVTINKVEITDNIIAERLHIGDGKRSQAIHIA